MSGTGSALLAGVLAGLAVAMPLGPIGLLVFQRGALAGFRTGAAAGLGVATADGLYALLAAAAGAGLVAVLSDAREPIRLVAALVLLAVVAHGLIGLRRARRSPDAPPRAVPAGRTFAVFLGLTAINPLTVATFAALIAGLPDLASGGLAEKAAFVAGAFLASAGWQTALAGAGAAAGSRLPPQARTWTTLAGLTIVLLLALRMLLG